MKQCSAWVFVGVLVISAMLWAQDVTEEQTAGTERGKLRVESTPSGAKVFIRTGGHNGFIEVGKSPPAQVEPILRTRTQDGLALRLQSDGTLAGLALDGRALSLSSETGGFYVTEFLPTHGARREWGIVRGRVTEQDGRLELGAQLAEAGLNFQARFQRRADYIEVGGEIADRTGHDRALLITFRLPLQAAGWRWGDDIERARPIVVGQTFHIDGRLGEKNDIPVSKLPFSALTADNSQPPRVGLSLAVPMHEPRVFRLFYDERGYQVSFQLGLAPEVSEAKSYATFRFILYRHDPTWGFRSAVQRYYEFFPELYIKRVEHEGSWGSFLMMPVKNLEDFAAVFCGSGAVTFTPAQAAFVKENRLYTFKHREPWARWHLVYPFQGQAWYAQFPKRRRDLSKPPPQPSLEEEIQMLHEETQMPQNVLDGNDQIPGPVREVAQATFNCLIYDEHSKPRRILWHRWSQGWHSQIPLNANPHLPSPNRTDLARKYQFHNMAAWDDPSALHVNGVSFDSLTNWTGFRWEDYRRENFKYATIPLTFCPRNGQVVQIKGFHDWEMAKVWSEEIRAKGRFLMANTDTQPYLFCGQFLDVMGIERSADVVSEEEMALVRTLSYQKPASYSRELTEQGMRKCLFYGIHPGGLRVLRSPEQAEAARPLFKKYAPLIQKIATAGWQPITHTRIQESKNQRIRKSANRRVSKAGRESNNSSLKIERFGDEGRGFYFTLRNSGDVVTTAEVVIDVAVLGLQDKLNLRAEEVLEKREITQRIEGNALKVTVHIESGETLVLVLKESS